MRNSLSSKIKEKIGYNLESAVWGWEKTYDDKDSEKNRVVTLRDRYLVCGKIDSIDEKVVVVEIPIELINKVSYDSLGLNIVMRFKNLYFEIVGDEDNLKQLCKDFKKEKVVTSNSAKEDVFTYSEGRNKEIFRVFQDKERTSHEGEGLNDKVDSNKIIPSFGLSDTETTRNIKNALKDEVIPPELEIIPDENKTPEIAIDIELNQPDVSNCKPVDVDADADAKSHEKILTEYDKNKKASDSKKKRSFFKKHSKKFIVLCAAIGVASLGLYFLDYSGYIDIVGKLKSLNLLTPVGSFIPSLR